METKNERMKHERKAIHDSTNLTGRRVLTEKRGKKSSRDKSMPENVSFFEINCLGMGGNEVCKDS